MPAGSTATARCAGAVISRLNAVRCALGCSGCERNCAVALSSISTCAPMKGERAMVQWARVSSKNSARWLNSRSNLCKTWTSPAYHPALQVESLP